MRNNFDVRLRLLAPAVYPCGCDVKQMYAGLFVGTKQLYKKRDLGENEHLQALMYKQWKTNNKIYI